MAEYRSNSGGGTGKQPPKERMKERATALLIEALVLWYDVRDSVRPSGRPPRGAVRRLEARAYVATIAAAVTAAVVFAWGLFTLVSQSATQNEAAAVAALQKHIELSLQNRELARWDGSLPEAPYGALNVRQRSYLWYGSETYTTAETVYNLTRGNEA